jgi:radical S-adenosyl methionine domain-containing protein 2
MRPATNRAIGRVDRRDRLLNQMELASLLVSARQSHPGLHIKLNTVVNQLNHDEDLSPLIQRMAPDKWKVLRMLPAVNHHLAVRDEEFAAFVARHQAFDHILYPEDNQDMCESYLMSIPTDGFFRTAQGLRDRVMPTARRFWRLEQQQPLSRWPLIPIRFSARYAKAKESLPYELLFK